MSRNRRILIVEDQKKERDALARVLKMEGYAPVGVPGIKEIGEYLGTQFDLVICDLRLGMECGLDALRVVRENWHGVPVIMVTAYGAIDSAVNAIKSGAIDYLTKPLKPAELLTLLNRYLPMERQANYAIQGDTWLENQLGDSIKMEATYAKVAQLAGQNCSVLITGEQGSGQELVAAAIHEQSARKHRPFVEFRANAFPISSIECELLGLGRNDYYGRSKASRGRIASANSGTLYIEDFFAIPPEIQRRLHGQLYSSPESNKPKATDVRLIASSNVALPDLFELESIDQQVLDLLCLNLIELPPLRDHPEDIPNLVDHYLNECARRHLRSRPTMDEELFDFLCGYEWPGNVRQLRNAIENMLVLSRGEQISMDDLSAFLGGGDFGDSTPLSSSEMSLSELERMAVIGALKRSLGNKTHAAQKLGISVRTLQRKMKQWKLEGSELDA
ncbi:MAG: sigma-54 dependent transcriptional regulator [Pirellulales bacterium]